MKTLEIKLVKKFLAHRPEILEYRPLIGFPICCIQILDLFLIFALGFHDLSQGNHWSDKYLRPVVLWCDCRIGQTRSTFNKEDQPCLGSPLGALISALKIFPNKSLMRSTVSTAFKLIFQSVYDLIVIFIWNSMSASARNFRTGKRMFDRVVFYNDMQFL